MPAGVEAGSDLLWIRGIQQQRDDVGTAQAEVPQHGVRARGILVERDQDEPGLELLQAPFETIDLGELPDALVAPARPEVDDGGELGPMSDLENLVRRMNCWTLGLL